MECDIGQLNRLIDWIESNVEEPSAEMTPAQRVSSHFLIRGASISKDITILMREGSYQNANALYRMLADRRILLRHLEECGAFEEFECVGLARSNRNLQRMFDVVLEAGIISDEDHTRAQSTASPDLKAGPAKSGNQKKWNQPQQMFQDVFGELIGRGMYLHYDAASLDVHARPDDSQPKTIDGRSMSYVLLPLAVLCTLTDLIVTTSFVFEPGWGSEILEELQSHMPEGDSA